MKRIAIPLVFAAGIGCTPAFAQQWYFGIGGGRASLGGADYLETTSTTTAVGGGIATSFEYSPTQFSGHDTSLTARYGWRFHRNMALELGYHDFGKYPFDVFVSDLEAGGVRSIAGTAKAKSLGLSFVGILPLDRFDLYGRIGYARSELEYSADSGSVSARRDIRLNEATGALGARWNATPSFGVFAEYMRHDKLDVDGFFVGVDFRF